MTHHETPAFVNIGEHSFRSVPIEPGDTVLDIMDRVQRILERSRRLSEIESPSPRQETLMQQLIARAALKCEIPGN